MVGWIDSIGQTYENVYDPAGRVVFQTGTDGIWASRFDYHANSPTGPAASPR